jgi:predicted transcriptional regulator
MGLKDMRKALRITQAEMAEAMGISQDGVSRIERRSDLRLSTIRSYIEALGGSLTLTAQLSVGEVVLSAFSSAPSER